VSSGSFSESGSASSSDVCCFPVTCACEDWLTSFCDYEAVTLTACDEEYAYEKARSSAVPTSAVNPQHGIFLADKVFRISMLENSVDVMAGATIVDETDVTWQVYRVEDLATFCVKKLWARSVQRCFLLTEDLEVCQERTDCADCGNDIGYDLAALVRGTVTCEAGTVATSNDKTRMNYRYTAVLEAWPLDEKPSAQHMIRKDGAEYRVLSFVDQGPYLPFSLTVEPRRDDCRDR